MTRTPLIYDQDCGFCRATLGLLLLWDRRRRLRPVQLDSPEAQELLRELPEERRRASWHLVDADGTVRSAGAGFGPLFRLLAGGRPLARVAERYHGLANRAYFFVATRRSRFGRYVPAALKHRADALIRRRA